MPLNLIFVSPGTYTIEDNGIPGDNTSVIKDGSGNVIFTFVHPADSLGFTTSTPGVNLIVNITDSLGAANVTIGDLANASASPDSIAVNTLSTSGVVTLVATGAVTEQGSDDGADIVAGQLIISAGTGVGAGGNALDTQTSAIEAETNTGGIAIDNFGTVQIGGISADVDGLDVATSGNINFTTVGAIYLADDTGAESVHGGSSSGNVTLVALGADSDIMATVDRDAINAPGGNILLEAGRDVAFGVVGSSYDNDVRARGSITVDAGRDFVIDGFSDLASDDFGAATGGDVRITTGRNIEVRSVTGTDGSIFANGDAGAGVFLVTGPNGAVAVDPASIGGLQPVASNSGDVVIIADRFLLNSASGIAAQDGEVTIRPVTRGREMILGSAGDSAFAVEISDAELNRVFTPSLTIGGDTAGNITVISDISPANAPGLTLRTGGDLRIDGAITTSLALGLRAGGSLFHESGAINTVNFRAFVDTLDNDGGAGGFGNLGTISAGLIELSGSADPDVLRGAENVDQTVHGNGGNDTITSSGEGHYFGDAGNDLMFAGLSSGVVPEVLDGGAGTDTLDTTSFTGNYTINMATGATNFAYESFVNFENLITSDGNDTITGTSGNNVIQSGAGDDNVDGGAGNDTLSGGAGADRLVGGSGADSLDGGSGVDIMRGGIGNDTYFADDFNDRAIENAGEGTDTVNSSANFTLGSNIENLVLTGTAIRGNGNSLANSITGNSANNILNGGAGADTMIGGAGNDTYYVDNAGDTMIESAGGGRDRVYTTINLTLGANLDDLFMRGSAAINATGNAQDNVLRGNSAANVLTGGVGADDLRGGGGADTFVWRDGDFAGLTPSTADRIIDFSHAEGDRINLGQVDANTNADGNQAFAFIGTSAFHNVAGELRYEIIGGNTYLTGDTDGDGTADFMIRLDGTHALVSGDFVL
jgi:Ca2+-binding RTX toxin-like protein